jgi:DMSO/TMAO reductase YedYZ molybdopterin-dependent catalytic subunit
VPLFDPERWRFRCWGLVAQETEWTWEEFRALPSVRVKADFHCVTGWSKLDNVWEGVSYRALEALASPAPAATHALVYAPYGYSANLPIEALRDDDVLFAWSHDGKPLDPEHGGPLRLVVPKRYAWKSVKWANGIQLLDRNARGYWEERGYHNDADPWTEERYSWQEAL